MMAKYKVTAPNGQQWEVTAPDDATEDQVLRYAQQEWKNEASGIGFNARNPQSVMATPSEFSPTEGIDKTQLLMEGMGARMMDAWLGAKQRFGAASEQDVMEKRGRDAPLMQTGPAQAGAFGAEMMPWMMGGAIPKGAGFLGSAITGGLVGGLRPTAEGESPFINSAAGVAGGLAGATVNKMGGGIFGPAKINDPALKAAVNYADKAGLPMTAGQRSGSEFLKRLEGQMAGLPGASGWFKRHRAAVEEAVNKTIARMTGDVKQRYANFANGKAVTIDKQFMDDLAKIPDAFKGVSPKMQPNTALAVVDDIVKGGNPVISPGATVPMGGPKGDFNNIISVRSYMAELGQRTTDSVDKAAYRKIVNSIDDMIERQFPNSGYKDLRSSYFVDRFVSKTRDEHGNISLQKLKNKVTAKDAQEKGVLDKLAGAKGDELRELSKVAPYVGPINDSGTAKNLLALQAATMGLGGIGGGGSYIFGQATGNDAAMDAGRGLMAMGGLAAALYPAPWLVNSFIQNRAVGILADPWLRVHAPAILQAFMADQAYKQANKP